MVVPKQFFCCSTVELARRLLGTFLVFDSPEGRTAGRIVETEAYLFRADPACHASRGQTKRNEVMFGPAGLAYIYFIYGMYYCLNVVSGRTGEGEAVLIRALEPVIGIDLMQQRRKTRESRRLCSGPGKLVLALGLDKSFNGWDLRKPPLQLFSRDSFCRQYRGDRKLKICRTKRIGLAQGKDLLLRFYLEDNPFISRK